MDESEIETEKQIGYEIKKDFYFGRLVERTVVALSRKTMPVPELIPVDTTSSQDKTSRKAPFKSQPYSC